MASARVTLGGVTLATPRWRWAFADGAHSPEYYLDVDNSVDEQLAAQANPVALTCETARDDDPAPIDINIADLHLIARRRLDPWQVRWVIADQRWLWKDVQVGAAFNVTRRANSLDVANVQTDIDDLLAQDATIRRYRYLPSTLRDPGSTPPRHFRVSVADLERNVGELWTALQVVEWLLARASVRPGLPKIRYRIEVADNRYVREDWVVGGAGAPFPTVLAEALNLARAGLYVSDTGEWVVYDVAAAPVSAKIGGYQTGGVLVREDLSRARPVSCAWHFLADHEILLEFDEAGTAGRNNDDPDVAMRTLENVAVVPETFSALGKDYVIGQYVPVFELIQAYDAAGWPTGKKITSLVNLRKWALAPRVAYLELARDPRIVFDQQAVARIASLLSAYRTIYRIPQPLLDATTTWEPKRAAKLDAITGQQQASPVWSDYCIVPTGKQVLRQGGTHFGSSNVSFPNNLATGRVAPLSLNVVDHDLGIVAIGAHSKDRVGRIDQVLPARLEDPLTITIDNLNDDGMLERKTLHTQHKIATIITVRFRNDTGPSKYTLRAQASSYGVQDAFGPPYEGTVLREPARFEWLINQTSLAEGANGGVVVKDARLLNRPLLGGLAKAEGQRLYFSFADRYVGSVSRPMYESGIDRPNGNASTVAIDFDRGMIRTTYYMPESVPPPDLYNLLPPDHRRFVFRQLDTVI